MVYFEYTYSPFFTYFEWEGKRMRTNYKNGMRRTCAATLVLALLMGSVQVAPQGTGTARAASKTAAADSAKKTTGKKTVRDYSTYSTVKHGWGLGRNTLHKVPGNGEAKGIKKKDAYYYVRTKKKKIYLTFDCGYENGYTRKILKILKKNNIKATFFVTKDYIRTSKKIVIRMKKDGHMVGNHTVNHPSLPTCSVARMKREIRQCAKFMKKETGYDMDPYLRPPMGEWSYQSLKVTQDLGYKTIFWSMAFYDYDTENQPGKQAIYNQFMTYYHKGAVVLLHAISRSDTEALPAIIKSMKKKGFTFGELTDLDPKEKSDSGKDSTSKGSTGKDSNQKNDEEI